MNRGSSASMCSGGQTGAALAIASSYHTSRPAFISTAVPVRLTTICFSIDGVSLIASSAVASAAPPCAAVGAVAGDEDLAGAVGDASRRESDEKPPNTMLWIAPMRVQASMEMASSGIIAGRCRRDRPS